VTFQQHKESSIVKRPTRSQQPRQSAGSRAKAGRPSLRDLVILLVISMILERILMLNASHKVECIGVHV
jgi:hypothetical protein